MTRTQTIQREYYARTAHLYDSEHVHQEDEHYCALKYVSGFVHILDISSVLDVGCGTGRGVKYFLRKHPHLRVRGIEPVTALIEQAVTTNSIPRGVITPGYGEALPFPDQSFDATFESGMLHHVREPNRVIQEMMRVSRKAIFLSDGNRFGCRSSLTRWAKLLLWKTGIFSTAYRLKTLGKGYRWSEGDGLSYSYSVFDSFDLLAEWADRIILIPTGDEKPKSVFHPLLTSLHVLVCAIRDRSPEAPKGNSREKAVEP